MALWLAKRIVEQQLAERAQVTTSWSACPACGASLVSKGWVKRQILTLVGQVEWKRRVGRCPHRCSGSQSAPYGGCVRSLFIGTNCDFSGLERLTCSHR
ncbi:MAG: hypothetical protein JOZ78_20210 [Chroococcidiopsidaceae cyanobacterium CP_BM_ER_R8_30]|nr:hypothetical protein [Chroococcidiopsidaceae cyanobacterium CP_BM_ER_R8_30]